MRESQSAVATDSMEWDRIESTELLNTVKYNYGRLVDNLNCCSYQKNSNRLAICTDKSLFIVNLNFNWPQVRKLHIFFRFV
jgi:hypothetical protein